MSKTLLRFTSRNHITDRWLRENPEVMIECWYCGRPVHKDDPRRKYCNKSCAKKYYRAIRKVPIYKYCDWCGDEFLALRKDKIWCAKSCSDFAYKKRKGLPMLTTEPIKCNWCGIKFFRSSANQRYCRFQCFFANRCYQKRKYHVRTRGAVRTSKFDNMVIPKNRIKVTEAEIKAAMEARFHTETENNEFNKEAWVERAKKSELALAGKYI